MSVMADGATFDLVGFAGRTDQKNNQFKLRATALHALRCNNQYLEE